MHRRLLAILGLLVLAFPGTSRAADVAQLDPVEVQKFITTNMQAQLKGSWTPGAVVAVVQQDHVVALAGVGSADINTQRPIDPNRTLFRVGSITKVMTTIAALRFVERGQLDLDKDVNQYLSGGVHVPDTFPEPVTAKAILGHHGGFETVLHHLQVETEAEARMSAQQINRDLIRVRPIDAPRIYDDLSYGLLGYTLGSIAGKRYAAVLDEEVFRPLGMSQATLGLPAERKADAASCHELGPDGKVRTCKQAILVDLAQPAGDASLTGADMAKFMIGLLQPGRVLSADMLARMKDVDAGRFHPLVPGLGMTLWESSAGGRVLYGHTGGIDGFLSIFALFPGSDIGVFVSLDIGFGSAPAMSISGLIESQEPPTPKDLVGPKDVALKFMDEFATAFVPPNAPPEQPRIELANSAAGTETPAADLAGAYFRSDQSRSLVVNLLATLSGESVQANADGSLTVNDRGPFNHFAKSYYRAIGKDGKQVGYAFKRDVLGRQWLENDAPWSAPFGIHQQQPWYKTAVWALLPLPVLLLLELSAFGRVHWEKERQRRRILKTAGWSALLFLLALLGELQFGEFCDHSVDLHGIALLWRLLFPIACAGFLYNVYLTVRMFMYRASKLVQAPIAIGYAWVLSIGGLGLVWLALLWRMTSLFLRW